MKKIILALFLLSAGLYGSGIFVGGGSSSGVSGPGTSTTNGLATYSNTSGATLLSSSVTLNTAGILKFGDNTGGSADNNITFGTAGVLINQSPSNLDRLFIRGNVVNLSNAGSASQWASLESDGFYLYPVPGTSTHYSQIDFNTAGLIILGSDVPVSLKSNAKVSVVADTTGSALIGQGLVATTAVNGFVYIPTCAGVPTGVPTSKSGFAAMVWDSSNSKLYVYSTTWNAMN